MNDKLKINLRIAGVVLPLIIAPEEEENLREVAREVNHVFDTYSRRFPGSPDLEILAKVTLLFAKGYVQTSHSAKEMEAELAEFESELDKLLEEG